MVNLMEPTDRGMLLQALRGDLVSFIQRVFQTVSPGSTYLYNWHVEAICYYLVACLRGKIKRLIITVPPRHLKSICASVGFPAWILGHDPARRIINVTYSNELTNDLSRQFRAVVNSDWYRRTFPAVKVAKETEAEFATTKGGFRYGTSVGGTLTGRGGNFIIIDDPIKPEEAMSKAARESVISWFKTTLTTRLDSKKDDVIILVMQRLHVDDLVGHVLESDPSGWTQLDLPAIAQEFQTIRIANGTFHDRKVGELLHPERESQQILDMLRLNMGCAVFSAQYLQRPIAEEGNMIKHDWFKFYDRPPRREPGDRIIQSWDTAMKPDQRNDPSVCTTWHEKNGPCYLIDVVRQRVDYPDLKRLVLSLRSKFAPDAVLIEDKGSGTALVQELANAGSPFPIAIDPKGDKLMRMHVQAAKIEAGQVYLPREASWLSEFLFEVLAFPRGRHDDQVDSLSQFLNWVGQPPPFFHYDFM